MSPSNAADSKQGDDTSIIETQPAPGVVWLTLNRPQVLNALNLNLRHRLADTFIRLASDTDVRAIVLGGSARAFCAGADLNEYVNATPTDVVARNMGELWDAIAACRKPVVAAVRGYALGGGCELAMHADIVVAGDTARLGQPEVRIGLMPGGGATQRLTRAVGKFQAMRLLLTGDRIDAERALRIGLISEMVADAEVDERALALATQLAALPVHALTAIKETVLAGMDVGLSPGLTLERRAFALLFDTPDKTEGISAQLDKRSPQFEHDKA